MQLNIVVKIPDFQRLQQACDMIQSDLSSSQTGGFFILKNFHKWQKCDITDIGAHVFDCPACSPELF